MSGTSRAERTLSRCVVTLVGGESVEWAGESTLAGEAYHQREEASFLRRIDAATPRIEVLFDELEAGGHRFESLVGALDAQVGESNECLVRLWCTPALSAMQLHRLARQIDELVTIDAPTEFEGREALPLAQTETTRAFRWGVVSVSSSRERAHIEAALDAAGDALDRLFDDLAKAGRTLVSPGSEGFATASQRAGATGAETVQVDVACRPPLDDDELLVLAERIAETLRASSRSFCDQSLSPQACISGGND